MKKYKVEITEILSRIVEVRAISSEEAIEKVEKLYEDGKIILDYTDHLETQIDIM